MDVALRRSIPASNQDVRNMQKALEDIAFKLRIPQRKPWQQMTEDVIKATSIVNNEAQVSCLLFDHLHFHSLHLLPHLSRIFQERVFTIYYADS